ncbi:MAG: hypothetical protein IPH58_09135 [Sphingobacteriales bacterium]|nr:hypothetical protein [Sphingobacteriales bacterium]
MPQLIGSLFVIPAIVSFLLLFIPKKAARLLTILTAFVLSFISLYLFGISGNQPISFSVPHYVNKIVIVADFLLLAYIIVQGFLQRSILVWVLAAIQAGVLGYLVAKMPHIEFQQFYVDKLSIFMFILVNVVSGVIAVFL